MSLLISLEHSHYLIWYCFISLFVIDSETVEDKQLTADEWFRVILLSFPKLPHYSEERTVWGWKAVWMDQLEHSVMPSKNVPNPLCWTSKWISWYCSQTYAFRHTNHFESRTLIRIGFMDPVLSRGTLAHDRSKRCENQINRLEDSEEEKTNQGL